MRWCDSVIEATNMNLTNLWEAVEDRRAWHALVHGVQIVGHDLMTKQQHINVTLMLLIQDTACGSFSHLARFHTGSMNSI